MSIKILGLDISTSNIGICVADENDKIHEFIPVSLNKYAKDKDLFKKLQLFEAVLDKVLEKYDIAHTFIEKPLDFFDSGKDKSKGSMAHTTIMLNQFNILCQYILHKRGMKYSLVASATALKCAIGRGVKPA